MTNYQAMTTQTDTLTWLSKSPQEKRITTVTIKRDEKVIEKIKERVEIAQEYYQQLIQEMR